MSDICIPAPELTQFAQQLLESSGVPVAKARLVATTLVAANLRGVDSHGVQLLTFYLDQLARGGLDPNADGHVFSENGPCLIYHGENGIGQYIAEICCGHAVRLAKSHGLSLVVARDSNHFGAAAWWAQKMSDAGQIGIVMCDASPMAPPWQAKEARLGTNPICMALPGPWLLDMATTTVAVGKIYKAALNRESSIPPGWAMDAEGVPTTDTQAALAGLPMPLGGYKGAGLAMMVEILCAALSGGAMSMELGGLRVRDRAFRVNQAFLAIEIERFMPVAEFRGRIEHLVAMIKSAAPARGYSEVLVAGDPEWRAEAERKHHGIPLGGGTWEALLAIADQLAVAPPKITEPQMNADQRR